MVRVEALELREGAHLAVRERDRRHARDGLLEVAVDARDALADHAIRAPHLAPEEVDRPHDHRQQPETRQREAPVHPQHDRDDPHEPQHVEDDGHGAGGEHLLQHVDVGGEPGDHTADGVPVEEAHREALDAGEERDAQIGETPLGQHHREVLLAVVSRELARNHREIHEP